MSSRALRKLQDNIDIPGEEELSEEEEVRVDSKKQRGFNAFLLVSKTGRHLTIGSTLHYLFS